MVMQPINTYKTVLQVFMIAFSFNTTKYPRNNFEIRNPRAQCYDYS